MPLNGSEREAGQRGQGLTATGGWGGGALLCSRVDSEERTGGQTFAWRAGPELGCSTRRQAGVLKTSWVRGHIIEAPCENPIQ